MLKDNLVHPILKHDLQQNFIVAFNLNKATSIWNVGLGARFYIPEGRGASRQFYPIFVKKQDRNGLKTLKSIHTEREEERRKKKEGRKTEEKNEKIEEK